MVILGGWEFLMGEVPLQSRPDPGLGLQVKLRKTFQGVASSSSSLPLSSLELGDTKVYEPYIPASWIDSGPTESGRSHPDEYLW